MLKHTITTQCDMCYNLVLKECRWSLAKEVREGCSYCWRNRNFLGRQVGAGSEKDIQGRSSSSVKAWQQASMKCESDIARAKVSVCVHKSCMYMCVWVLVMKCRQVKRVLGNQAMKVVWGLMKVWHEMLRSLAFEYLHYQIFFLERSYWFQSGWWIRAGWV